MSGIRTRDRDKVIRSKPCSEAERELGVLGHHLRGPGWVEDHLRVDRGDAGEVADELLHLFGDLGADRAGRRGQGEGDVDVLASRSRRRRRGRARRSRGRARGR